jgi:hypothetical protein
MFIIEISSFCCLKCKYKQFVAIIKINLSKIDINLFIKPDF